MLSTINLVPLLFQHFPYVFDWGGGGVVKFFLPFYNLWHILLKDLLCHKITVGFVAYKKIQSWNGSCMPAAYPVDDLSAE